jgi:hypothetical protein
VLRQSEQSLEREIAALAGERQPLLGVSRPPQRGCAFARTGEAVFTRRWPVETLPIPHHQTERDLGEGQAQRFDQSQRGAQFAGRGVQELPARGRVVKEVGDLDRGSGSPRRRAPRGHAAAIDRDERRGLAAFPPRRDPHAADRGDAGQGFSTEAERGQPVEVFERADLAGGVALERELDLVGGDPAPVVGHLEAALELAVDPHFDAPRSGIERVLEDLLEGGKRPLDHLTGGDPRCGLRC